MYNNWLQAILDQNPESIESTPSGIQSAGSTYTSTIPSSQSTQSSSHSIRSRSNNYTSPIPSDESDTHTNTPKSQQLSMNELSQDEFDKHKSQYDDKYQSAFPYILEVHLICLFITVLLCLGWFWSKKYKKILLIAILTISAFFTTYSLFILGVKTPASPLHVLLLLFWYFIEYIAALYSLNYTDTNTMLKEIIIGGIGTINAGLFIFILFSGSGGYKLFEM